MNRPASMNLFLFLYFAGFLALSSFYVALGAATSQTRVAFLITCLVLGVFAHRWGSRLIAWILTAIVLITAFRLRGLAATLVVEGALPMWYVATAYVALLSSLVALHWPASRKWRHWKTQSGVRADIFR